jgi:hypothetical protein
MIETFYGPRNIALGILIDQMGTYLVLSTLGILIPALYGGEPGGVTAKSVAKRVAKRVLTFAPFLAFAASLLLMPFDYPKPFVTLLRGLAATLVPLALPSVGFQIQWSAVKGKMKELGSGLAFKLVFAPALIALLFIAVFRRAWRGRSDLGLRGGDGPADRRVDRRHGAQPRSAARDADGGHRHSVVVPRAADVVVSVEAVWGMRAEGMASDTKVSGSVQSLDHLVRAHRQG